MRLLIVEDQEEIAEALKANFASEQFAIDLAMDGNRGFFLACTNEYDLIILDLVLPGKLGSDICRELRERGKTVPIIILSVQSDITSKVDMLNFGADDYLIKPFSFSELLARVRALLRRPRAVEAEVLSVSNLFLYVTEQRVVRGDREIYLTRKEFQLLEYLIRNQGKVLSRGLIMEHVWDMNADPFSNTLETHILNLRRKIDVQGEPRLIQTVPTRGYRLAVA